MRERFVVRPVVITQTHYEIVDSDTGTIVQTLNWEGSDDGINPEIVTNWEREEDARVHADYRNALEQYQRESDDVVGDEYIDLEEPVNGFVEYPYGGRPVCFRCFVEWIGAGEEVLNYRRFEGTEKGIDCVNDCGGGKVKKWVYE